jgi:PAS domain-containing protein
MNREGRLTIPNRAGYFYWEIMIYPLTDIYSTRPKEQDYCPEEVLDTDRPILRSGERLVLMTPKQISSPVPVPCQSDLRDQAEPRLQWKSAEKRSPEDTARLVEDLMIHQEELKIQNEELKRIRLELATTKARYFELYDLAPVGYLTLSTELIIKQANLAASILLGCERSRLIGKGCPLS